MDAGLGSSAGRGAQQHAEQQAKQSAGKHIFSLRDSRGVRGDAALALTVGDLALDKLSGNCQETGSLQAHQYLFELNSGNFVRKCSRHDVQQVHSSSALAKQFDSKRDEDGASAHSQRKQPLLPGLRANLEELPYLRHAHDDDLRGHSICISHNLFQQGS